jgi:hypothetical protein
MALTGKATPILVVTVDAMAVRECELSCLSPFPNRSCYVLGYGQPLPDDQATVAS